MSCGQQAKQGVLYDQRLNLSVPEFSVAMQKHNYNNVIEATRKKNIILFM